jgi:hypothetical protein
VTCALFILKKGVETASVFNRLGPIAETHESRPLTRSARPKKAWRPREIHSVNMTYVTFDGVTSEDFEDPPEAIEEARMVSSRRGRPKGGKRKEEESSELPEHDLETVPEGLNLEAEGTEQGEEGSAHDT